MTQDTHTVLTELIERMEGERISESGTIQVTYSDGTIHNMHADSDRMLAHNAAITRCISLVEEKMKELAEEESHEGVEERTEGKYIVFTDGTATCFPKHNTHLWMEGEKKAASAGFYSIEDGVVRCYGESGTLGVKSHPEDSDIIQEFIRHLNTKKHE